MAVCGGHLSCISICKGEMLEVVGRSVEAIAPYVTEFEATGV